MASSILGLGNYSGLFSYPSGIKSSSPSTEFLYGASVTALYARKLSDKLTSEMSKNFSVLKSTAYELKTSSQNLIESNQNSVFNAKSASSDNSAVSASALNGARNQTYNLSVTQIAGAQKNKSNLLDSSSLTGLAEGTYSFKISSGIKQTTVSFSVKAGETNRETLTNMASAINQSNSGVTAKVISDDTNDTSYLDITGNQTGTKSTFSITDISGNASEQTGINTVSTAAQDAKYKINDMEFTSQTNNISIDNGKVNITLNKAVDKATIKIEDDNKAIADEISSFGQKFNKALESANYSDSAISQQLGSQLKAIVTSKKGSLDSIGINVSSDGSLRIDKDKLNKSLEEDPSKVKKLIGGFDGIAQKTKKLSDRILTSSAYDSSGNSFSNNSLNSFYNYFRNANKDLMIRNQSLGLFVDTLL